MILTQGLFLNFYSVLLFTTSSPVLTEALRTLNAHFSGEGCNLKQF